MVTHFTANTKVLSVSLFNFADEKDFSALLGTKIALFLLTIIVFIGQAMIMNSEHRKFTIWLY